MVWPASGYNPAHVEDILKQITVNTDQDKQLELLGVAEERYKTAIGDYKGAKRNLDEAQAAETRARREVHKQRAGVNYIRAFMRRKLEDYPDPFDEVEQ